MLGTQESVFRFGDVEVREREFRLIKAGEVIPVEPKAFRVLLFLLHNPQKLITKEELLNAVWGETAVSENSLTRSIALLRRLLGEDTHEPRFIETVATVGYRFICPVVNEESSASSQVAAEVPISGATRPMPDVAKPATTEAKSHGWLRWWPWALIAGASVVVISAGLLIWYASQPVPPPHISEYVQLTNDSRWGKIVLGSDGSRIYLALDPPALGHIPIAGGDITIVPLNVPGAKPLSATSLGDISPDGSSLFVVGATYSEGDGPDQWVVGTEGSPARYLMRGITPAWSPDGKQVVYSTAKGYIYSMPSGGGEPHLLLASSGSVPSALSIRLTGAESGSPVTIGSGRSPRTAGISASSFLAGTDPAGGTVGTGLLMGTSTSFSLDTPIASDNPRTNEQIWAIDERRGTLRRPNSGPIRLTFGPMRWPAGDYPSRDGKKIFAIGVINRGEVTQVDRNSGQLRPFLHGISAEMVDFSRDRRFVTYTSFPDGVLWRANRDGTGVQELAKPRVLIVNPRLSPDGRQLVFVDSVQRTNAPGDSLSVIFLQSSEGGTPVRILTDDKEPESDPTWSPDGKQIAFQSGAPPCCGPDTKLEIKILDVETGKTKLLPSAPQPAWSPRWSPDGRYIVCVAASWPGPNGLEVYDLRTLRWTVLLFQKQGAVGWPSWSHDSRSVYYDLSSAGDYSGANLHAVFRISLGGGTPERVVDGTSGRRSRTSLIARGTATSSACNPERPCPRSTRNLPAIGHLQQRSPILRITAVQWRRVQRGFLTFSERAVALAPRNRVPGPRQAPEVTGVADRRHEQHEEAEPDLDAPGEPARIDDLDQVVRDEPAVVRGLAASAAQVVLQRG